MACFFGASASIFVAFDGGCLGGQYDSNHEHPTCVNGFLGNDVKKFMLFVAVTVPCIVLVGAAVSSEWPPQDEKNACAHESGDTRKRFQYILIVTTCVLVWNCVFKFVSLEGDKSVNKWANYGLLFLLLLFLLVPYRSGRWSYSSHELLGDTWYGFGSHSRLEAGLDPSNLQHFSNRTYLSRKFKKGTMYF